MDVFRRDDGDFLMDDGMSGIAGDSNAASDAQHPAEPSKKYAAGVPAVAMQPPFQPGSTPKFLTHRFMVRYNHTTTLQKY